MFSILFFPWGAKSGSLDFAEELAFCDRKTKYANCPDEAEDNGIYRPGASGC